MVRFSSRNISLLKPTGRNRDVCLQCFVAGPLKKLGTPSEKKPKVFARMWSQIFAQTSESSNSEGCKISVCVRITTQLANQKSLKGNGLMFKRSIREAQVATFVVRTRDIFGIPTLAICKFIYICVYVCDEYIYIYIYISIYMYV